MTIEDTYQISPDWGTMTRPLIRRLRNPNGISGSPLERLHHIGLEQFGKAEIPNRKNEDWKYTPVREIISLDLAEPGPPKGDLSWASPYLNAFEAINLVFVNGHFIAELSDPIPDGIWIGPVNDAIHDSEKAGLLDQLVGKLENALMTPFEALVTSITPNGQCIVADPDVRIEKPIHVVNLSNPEGGAAQHLYPYILMIVGRNAELDMVESFAGPQTEAVSVTNSVNHIWVDRGAQLRHYRLQNENMASFHINATRVYQEADSTYSSYAAEIGSKLARNNIEVVHGGTNITSNLYGLFVARGRQHMDTQTFVDHAMPHCVSNELYKGILDEYARGVFNGKILVRQDAQKTNAYQQNSTLILSKNAIMDSKPQLEIFADDVRCTHGATIGQLDEDALFYLRSRGLTKAQASAMLQQAFIGDVLEKFPNEQIRTYFRNQISARHNV